MHGVQLARLAGAFTIAVTTSPDKAAAIRAIGADAVLVVGRGEDFSAQVKALTDGEGVDVAIDNVGAPVFHAVRRSMAAGGRMVLVGQLTGAFIRVNPAQLFLRGVSVLSAKGVTRAQLERSLRLVQQGRVRPVIAATLPLAQAAEAHRLTEAATPIGRIVLIP